MNAAYSSGWCEQSFGIKLTAVEISCRAKGDKHCTFIMAPPDKIKEYLTDSVLNEPKRPKIPIFFERKNIERKMKKSLEEKEILLREIHHRVKNNLQIITSFLNLQFNNIEDKNVIDAISKSKSRINSMALIHTKLYQSNNLSSIDFNEYINELVQSITDSYVLDNNIKCSVKHSNAVFNIDLSINLGLIITELLTNACKHAFKEKSKGCIKIGLTSMTNNKQQLIIEDNGSGLPHDIDMSDPKTLGLEIVVGLINQINGTIESDSSDGLKYVINFES
jgi:two-component sensor histidine kinase